MNQNKQRSTILSWLLGIPLLVVLFLEQPDFTGETLALWLMFAAMLAFTLNLGLAFSEGEISAAYSVGIMSYFTLVTSSNETTIWQVDEERVLALWAVFVGSVAGIFIRQAQRHNWHNWNLIRKTSIEPAIRTAGQLTIGLFASTFIYQLLDGRLPLDTFTLDDALPISGMIGSYLAFYLAIVIIKMRLQGSDFEETMLLNWQSLLVILFAPLPVAILGPVFYHSISLLSFGLLVIGLLIVVTGTYGFSVTQYRYEQRVRELSSLTLMNSTMQRNLDLHILLQTIYLQVANLLDIHNFMLVIQDPATRQLKYMVSMRGGQEYPVPNRKPGNGLIEHVIEQQSPLLIPAAVTATASRMGRVATEKFLHSWVGVPLVTSDRLKGAIVVYTTPGERQLNRGDQRLLTTIATQASIAIDNAQLYTQAQSRVKQLRALTEASTSLTRTLDFQEVLYSICSLGRTVSGADAAALFMWWDDEKETLALASHDGLSSSFALDPSLPLFNQEDRSKLETRQQPVIVNNVQEDKRTQSVRKTMKRENKQAWIEVLLRDAEDLIGVLVVYYDIARIFTDEDNEVLRTFASQAGLSIMNARRYGQADAALTRRMEQMYSLQQLSYDLFGGRTELDHIYERVLRRAMEGTQSDAAHLSLKLESDQAARCVFSIGFPDELSEKVEPMNQVTRHVLKLGENTQVREILEDKKYKPLRPETKSHLSTPILRDLEIIGVLTLESDLPDNFAANDKYFVMQVGAQAKAAIENYNLLSNIENTRDRLQVILDSMVEGVLLVDNRGHVRLANPRIQALLDLDTEKITDKPITELLDIPEMEFARKLGFESDQLRQILKQLMDKSWMLLEGYKDFSIGDENKKRFLHRFDIAVKRHENSQSIIGWLMVFRDVTEEKELSQAREDLSNMIIHDLRAPLTAINTGLKLIDTVVSDDDKIGQVVHKTTDSAGRAARKLLRLVNALLDVSRMESGMMALKREAGNFHEITELVSQELSPLAGEMEVEVLNRVDAKLPLLDIDVDKIERVLLNLMDNAIKFTPGAGQVVIDAELTADPAENSDGQHMRIQVIDNGPGIPDDYKVRLFERYVQVEGRSGRRRGTGLGLTFCRLTVEAHGGQIWVEDNPDGGSIFNFTLPVLSHSNNGKEQPPAKETAPELTDESVPSNSSESAEGKKDKQKSDPFKK